MSSAVNPLIKDAALSLISLRPHNMPGGGKLKGQYQEIVDLYLTGDFTQRNLATRYGVDKHAISHILRTSIPLETLKSIASKALHRSRQSRHNWKGGRRINKNGYVELNIAGAYLKEHRVVAVQKLGRQLTEKEIVHHINGNKLDNAEENLLVLPDQSTHNSLHAYIYQRLGSLFPDIMHQLTKEFLTQLELVP